MGADTAAAQRAVEELVGHYQAKARAVGRLGVAIGASAGVLVGAVPLSPLRFAWPIPSSYGFATILGGLIVGVMIGYVIGDARAQMYHRMAEQSRLQLQLEQRISENDTRMAQLLTALTARATASARARQAPQPVQAPPVVQAAPPVQAASGRSGSARRFRPRHRSSSPSLSRRSPARRAPAGRAAARPAAAAGSRVVVPVPPAPAPARTRSCSGPAASPCRIRAAASCPHSLPSTWRRSRRRSLRHRSQPRTAQRLRRSRRRSPASPSR